jgi:hypothetical protein
MLRPMRRLLVLITLAVLAFPAPASATIRAFQSPTGKIGCLYFRDPDSPASVRCDWRGGNDEAVKVDVHHKGRVIHVTDTVLDQDAPVLAYGHTRRFGSLSCTSRRTGMTCRSRRSGHGFTVSVEKRVVF